jgi:hypothetical protein
LDTYIRNFSHKRARKRIAAWGCGEAAERARIYCKLFMITGCWSVSAMLTREPEVILNIEPDNKGRATADSASPGSLTDGENGSVSMHSLVIGKADLE